MSYREPLSRTAVAIAVSESADMAALGLAPEHLRDAAAEIARHLLAMGARLVYGGDLRVGGFTELLFELVARYRRDADVGDTRRAVVNYFAWPVIAAKSAVELKVLEAELADLAELHFLDSDGADLAPAALNKGQRPEVTDADWARALTAMRRVVTGVSDARVVLGGPTQDYKGRMPGIVEEALSSLQAGQPLFVLGGFGGCARDVAVALRLIPAAAGPAWPGAESVSAFDGSAALKNGLTPDENAKLARTSHIDEAVALILRGLLRLAAHNAGAA